MPIAFNEQTGEAMALGQDGQWSPTKLATNPRTGERLAFDGAEWKPVGTPKPAAPSPSIMDSLSNFNSSFANGMTGGFYDELIKAPIQTGVDAMFDMFGAPKKPGVGEGYSANLAAANAQRGKDAQSMPYTSYGGEIAGALTSPIVRALTPGAAAPTMTGRALQAGKSGAAIGTVYSAGNSEGDLGERAKSTLAGTVLGGAGGLVLSPAIELAAKGATTLANQTINRLPFRQGDAAARKVAEALVNDGLTPAQAMTRIQQMGPQAALMDVGPNSRQLAMSAYNVPGEGKAAIGDFLTARQEGTRAADKTLQGGQINRIVDGMDTLIPDRSGTIRKGVQAARTVHGQDYEAARSANVAVDINPLLADIDAQLTTAKGGIRSGLEKVRSFLVDVDGNPEVSVDALHQAKMAIDDLMTGEANTSMGRVTKGLVRDTQTKLVQAIEDASPSYRTGRLGTAAAWRIDDALNTGEQFMLKRVFSGAQEMQETLAKMTPEELHAFRVGSAQAIKSKLMEMNTRSDATKKIMDIPALEQKIQLAFGDKDTFARYIQMLQNERTMFDSYAKIMGGSKTGEALAGQEAAKSDPGRAVQALKDIFKPNSIVDPVRGVVNLLGAGKDRIVMPGPLSGRLAKLLTGQDTTALNDIFQAAQTNPALRQRLTQGLVSLGASRTGNQGQ